MKRDYILGIGFIGVAGFAIYEAAKIDGLEAKLSDVISGVNYIHDKTDINVSEDIANQLIRQEASKIASESVYKASNLARKEIEDEISKKVKEAVNEAYTSLQGDLQKKLEKEINLQTIEKIEKGVVEKVSKQVIGRLSFYPNYGGNSKESIVKECIKEGMDSFEISRIMDVLK